MAATSALVPKTEQGAYSLPEPEFLEPLPSRDEDETDALCDEARHLCLPRVKLSAAQRQLLGIVNHAARVVTKLFQARTHAKVRTAGIVQFDDSFALIMAHSKGVDGLLNESLKGVVELGIFTPLMLVYAGFTAGLFMGQQLAASKKALGIKH